MTITPEIEAKWRADFEREIMEKHKHLTIERSKIGRYSHLGVDTAWRGFLMGRSTVEIELPKLISGSGASHVGHSLGVQQCWAHIESQGYRVKGES